MVDFLKKGVCYKIVEKCFVYFDKFGTRFTQEEINAEAYSLDSSLHLLLGFEVPFIREDINDVINKKS